MSHFDSKTGGGPLGSAEWLMGFVERFPPASGLPAKAPPPLKPPPLTLEPGSDQVDEEIVLVEVRQKRSHAIRQGWQGRFQSVKLDRTVRWRSQLLFELFCHWEVDPTVTDFDFRPVLIRFRDKAGRSSVTPAASARTQSGVWFYEVCWEASVTPQKLERWSRCGRKIAAAGFGFQVLTESQIRRQPRWTNVRNIVRAMPAADPDESQVARAREVLAGGGAPASDLLDGGVTLKSLMRLVLRGVIGFDLDQPFGPATWISRSASSEW